MTLGLRSAEDIARNHGDSFYVFDERRFVENFNSLRDAFREFYPDTEIAYSYKTNYTPHICRVAHGLGAHAEVVSEMEYRLARKMTIDPSRIIYNGPYKSAQSLRDALLDGATVNLDSSRDVEMAIALAKAAPDSTLCVGIRCNFNLGSDRESRFGMDVTGEEFSTAINLLRSIGNIELAGLHCHYPQRDIDSFRLRTWHMLEAVDKWFEHPPRFLNIGGGFFGCLPETLRSRYRHDVPTFPDYAEAVGEMVSARFDGVTEKPTLFIEPGTALVADTLSFVTRVIAEKKIRGRHFLFTAGSIFNISPYARVKTLPFKVHFQCEKTRSDLREVDICGYTCIESDFLASDVMTDASPGDFLEFSNVGSYSLVMKPPFILPNVAVIRAEDGLILKRSETLDDIFSTYPLAQ